MKGNIFTVLACICIQAASLQAQNQTIIEQEGSRIHYRTYGNGIPLLIINGGPGMSSEGFIPLAKELAKNHQTILYDQRGTGLSTVDTINRNSITMELMVQDLEVLRKHLEIDQWVIMGHSFGGMLAYYYAAKYPDRVLAMIQSSSGGMDLSLLSSLRITDGLSSMQRDSLAFYTAKINDGDNSYETRLKRGEFLAPAYLYDQKHVPVIAERLTQGNSRINSLVWQDLRRIGYDTKDAMTNFGKPVLILQGAQDVLDVGIAKSAHQILPQSQLVILDRCKHYGWLDRPELYFGEIRHFMQEVYHVLDG